jgi:hypothetical protein
MIAGGYKQEIFFESRRSLNIQLKAMGNWGLIITTTIVKTRTMSNTATPNHKDGKIKKCD